MISNESLYTYFKGLFAQLRKYLFYVITLRSGEPTLRGALRPGKKLKLTFSAEGLLRLVRSKLVKEYLPAAQVIVDLSDPGSNTSLLEMGYPYQPHELICRGEASSEPKKGTPSKEAEMTRRYLNEPLAGLHSLPDSTVDLVWGSDMIEHIDDLEAGQVFEDIFRVLLPGGHFCLDLHNSRLARLQQPDRYLHPDHQMEYTVDQIRVKLRRCGFKIVEEKGLCPMPMSLKEGRFSLLERMANSIISDNANTGYRFYIKAVRPRGDSQLPA